MLRKSPLLITSLGLGGCIVRASVPGPGEPVPAATAQATPQDLFWANLSQHCGHAFPGRLTLEPPGDDMLTGTEDLIVHFRQCGADTLKLPFHIEKEEARTWDRSRTWVFMRTAQGLELRHDHRHEDGTPHDQNWYGGHTSDRGTAYRQEFVLEERRAADGSLLGWRVEVVPGERYTYGTIRGGEWTWRVDFDLSRPLPAPPAPWGHEASVGSFTGEPTAASVTETAAPIANASRQDCDRAFTRTLSMARGYGTASRERHPGIPLR